MRRLGSAVYFGFVGRYPCALEKLRILRDPVETSIRKLGVVGLGYVGIPLSVVAAKAGLEVVGFDIDQRRVDLLNARTSPIRNIPDEMIATIRELNFRATTDFAEASGVHAILICVQTPLDKMQQPDLSYVTATIAQLLPHLTKGQMLSLESTTWPGTTHEVIRPALEGAGFTIGEDMFLVYSPEREDPGNEHFNTKTIPKVVGGETETCLKKGIETYSKFIDTVVPVSSTQAAELVKLLENIQRSVNIGLMNEMKMVADKMGLNIFEIVEAAATKPFGFSKYLPGPGVGGHCIPIDPFYLTWKAREYGLRTRFIELAGEINSSMPDFVVSKIASALNEAEKSVKGAKILCVGISYKPNVEDVRESPSVFVMEGLRDLGAEVSYHDPFVPKFPEMREHSFDLSSVPLTAENLNGQDLVVLLTNHKDLDLDLISEESSILVDTRGVFRSYKEGLILA